MAPSHRSGPRRVLVWVAVAASLLLAAFVVLAIALGTEVADDVAAEDRDVRPATTTGADDLPPPKGSAGVAGCPQSELGGDDLISFLSAGRVREGRLAGPCLGSLDPVLLETWEILEAIAPVEDLADIRLLAGYRSGEDEDDVTLAYVQPLDPDEGFQLSINLEEARLDPATFRLTVVHEFAHVLAGRDDQLMGRRTTTCPTFDSGSGCLRRDAWLARWVDDFWADRLERFDPDDDPRPEDGDRACRVDPGYLGAYAASHPEEDFAETFSAFVLAVEVNRGLDEKIAFFAQDPHLAAYRDRALAAGLGPAKNRFERCG